MKTLMIDTSTNTASVAVFDGEQLLGEFMLNTPITHSQKLMPMVENLLSMLRLKVKDIELMIACEGPGSFTGVRIGLSTVKAFAQPFNTPILTDTSLALLAGGFQGFSGVILTMLDAKRNEVYYGLMKWEGDQLIKLEEAVENVEELMKRVSDTYKHERVLIAGDAIDNYPDIIQSYSAAENIFLASPTQNIPRASNFKYLINTESDRISYLDVKANYMRKSQAERDLDRKEKS